MAANGANRLRLAAEAIAGMRPVPVTGGPWEPVGAALVGQADAVQRWYRAASAALAGAGSGVPEPEQPEAETIVLSSVAAAADGLGSPAGMAAARALWGLSLYVDDVTRLQERVEPSIRAVSPARRGR